MDRTSLLNSIIDNAIDGILTINQRGIVETINPAGCKLFGYDEDEVIGCNVSMLMPQPDKGQHNTYLSRYQGTGEPHIIGIGREVKGLRKDGSVFPFRLAVSEVKLTERVIYAGFIHDISREKEAEERILNYTQELEELVNDRTHSLKKTVIALEEAKEEVSVSLEKEKELGLLKSRFVSMASHEFRTPLSSIQLSASLIDKYSQPLNNHNISKHISKIKNAVGNLTNILNDFLSLERLDTGKIDATMSEFDLVHLSEEITEEMQVMAKNEQHIIYQHTGTKNHVFLDQNLLKNCIVNLIANSIKYSGEKTFIEFNTEISETGCSIVVKDNGIGIPETDQKHLFEPFFRAHNTGNIPGTGLGLNIVQRYAELMHGRVEFQSTVNKGTQFTLVFNSIKSAE